jgi:transcriptional regulator with XRE-family HTH domain
MTGSELKKIRQKMGLERLELARLMGYTGSDRNDITRIKQYERDAKQVPLYIARLVWLLAAHQRRTSILPEFPGWPGYEFESKPDDPRPPLDYAYRGNTR